MIRKLKHCLLDEKHKILLSDVPTVTPIETSLPHLLLKSFDLHRGKIFLTEGDTRKCALFEEIKEMSLRIASSCIHSLKLNCGDVAFGFASSNIVYAATVYACIFTGLVFTGDTGVVTAVNLIPHLKDCRAKVVFCEENNIDVLDEALIQCPHVEIVVVLDAKDVVKHDRWMKSVRVVSVNELIDDGRADDPLVPRLPCVDARDHLVFLPYSSGSTGMPKGVKRCAYSLISMCCNIQRLKFFGDEDDVLSCFQSFGHMSGQISLIVNLYNGRHVILIREASNDKVLDAVNNHKITNAFIAPTMVQALSKMNLPPHIDLSSLRCVSVAGAPVNKSSVDLFLQKIPSVKEFYNVYGLSEGSFATQTPSGCDEYNSIGAVVQGVELQIVDRESGQCCSPREIGEIYVRSQMCASGYLDRPEAQDEIWTDDGWVRTGDAGYFDEDGLVFVVDRFKEMIKVHINQVAPAELQAILCQHPQVAEACVVATPHPVTGETPRAFVVPSDVNNLPSVDELLAFVNEKVVHYRQIRGGLFLVESLPKMVIGKINRQLVKKNPEKLVYLNPGNVTRVE